VEFSWSVSQPCSEIGKRALKGQEHIKSDERILGDSDFVADVISQANEKFEMIFLEA
jgi:hypothetical protein